MVPRTPLKGQAIMARSIAFVPSVATAWTPAGLTLEDVPVDVREEVEQIYVALKTNAGRMLAAFDTAEELATYEAQVKAYCALRPAGEIRYRRSPVKDGGPLQLAFRIVDLLTEEEKATLKIRNDAAKAKKAAKDAAAAVQTPAQPAAPAKRAPAKVAGIPAAKFTAPAATPATVAAKRGRK